MKTFPSKHPLAITRALCIVYAALARASFANIYQEFGTMTHLSSHDISSANSGHSQPQLSLRSARWQAEQKFPQRRQGLSAPSIASTEHRGQPTPGI